MAETLLVEETRFWSPLSPQRSQASLYSSPEVLPVDLYQTGGKPHDGSPGLSSSFVLISDVSNSGEQPLSSEYVEVQKVEIQPEDVNTVSSLEGRVADTTRPNVVCPGTVTGSTSYVPKWLGESTQRSHLFAAGALVPIETAKLLHVSKPEPLTFEIGTQTSSHLSTHVRDGATQTLTEIKCSKKQLPAVEATTPTSILEHPGLHDDLMSSPLASPSDEVVEMSASTVLIERHISQKEGRMLKSSNKELRLKIKKLTEVLEQMQKENKLLKNESESGKEIGSAQSALDDKESEHKRQIEEMKKEQATEWEHHKKEIQKAVEYEERMKEKFEENAKVIADLQMSVSALQKQLVEAEETSKKYSTEVEALTLKLEACETKALVTESENSVLNVKVNHLIKELSALKRSKHHHHHHLHHHQQQQSDERSKEHVNSGNKEKKPPMMDQSMEDVAAKSDEQELSKVDNLEKHAGAVSTKTGDEAKVEASVENDVKSSLSHPKPRPRQRHHHALAGSNAVLNKASKPKETRPPSNRPVQALVAPKLPSVAHLQPLHKLPIGAKYGQLCLQPEDQKQWVSKQTLPVAHRESVLENEGRQDRPSFLPLKGKTLVPLQLAKQPPPSPSEVQKLAATANWVQQLPEPKQRVEKHKQKNVDKTEKQRDDPEREASVLSAAAGGDDLNSLSEERIEAITRELKGDSGVICECPICGKVLHSRESDYGVLLHVELCLQQSEAANAN